MGVLQYAYWIVLMLPTFPSSKLSPCKLLQGHWRTCSDTIWFVNGRPMACLSCQRRCYVGITFWSLFSGVLACQSILYQKTCVQRFNLLLILSFTQLTVNKMHGTLFSFSIKGIDSTIIIGIKILTMFTYSSITWFNCGLTNSQHRKLMNYVA